MRDVSSLVGVDVMKHFARGNVVDRRNARSIGSPSPSSITGMRSTSSKKRFGTDIDATSSGMLADPVYSTKPGPCFSCSVLPELARRPSGRTPRSAGVVAIIASRRVRTHLRATFSVGNSTRNDPGI
jgi:hypothetical protein